jgi:hypothetical protein
MSYVFTTSERAQIQAAIDASTGLTFNAALGKYEAGGTVGSNAVPLYQAIYDIISSHLLVGDVSGDDNQDMRTETNRVRSFIIRPTTLDKPKGV